jgi:hypothetical protein
LGDFCFTEMWDEKGGGREADELCESQAEPGSQGFERSEKNL